MSKQCNNNDIFLNCRATWTGVSTYCMRVWRAHNLHSNSCTEILIVHWCFFFAVSVIAVYLNDKINQHKKDRTVILCWLSTNIHSLNKIFCRPRSCRSLSHRIFCLKSGLLQVFIDEAIDPQSRTKEGNQQRKTHLARDSQTNRATDLLIKKVIEVERGGGIIYPSSSKLITLDVFPLLIQFACRLNSSASRS